MFFFPAGCDFEPGYFLGGNNLREPFEVEDSDGCGLQCARWPKCAFWTFKWVDHNRISEQVLDWKHLSRGITTAGWWTVVLRKPMTLMAMWGVHLVTVSKTIPMKKVQILWTLHLLKKGSLLPFVGLHDKYYEDKLNCPHPDPFLGMVS